MKKHTKGAFKKTLKNILFITMPTFFIILILLEVFFRTVIPACEHPQGYFGEKNKICTSGKSYYKGLYTIGKYAEIKSKWRLNNMGYNYPINYYPLEKDRKLIAIIGDSFIEALQVDVGKNYPFLLREKLKNDYEIYAFGKSDAPLSEYLNISRYVNKNFNPDILIFNLAHNDFDESIQKFKSYCSYFLQLSINEQDSIVETIPRLNNYLVQKNTMKRLMYKSAIIRYLYFNLRLKNVWGMLFNLDKNTFEANINAEEAKKNMKLILKTTNYLVKTIRKENSNKRIIFVMDVPRYAIYDNTLEKSNVLWLNKMMDTICSNNKVEYIDLTSFMREDYRKNKIKFDFGIDYHWNEYGHKFVANVLYEYLKK